MPTNINRQWRLARRPRGELSAEDFKWVEEPIPEPAEGEYLVRNLMLSCDPTQRGWAAGDTYFPAVRIGDVMRSFTVGEVVQSRDPQHPKGELVHGMFGWQDYALSSGEASVCPIMPVPEGESIETALSILGNTGMTAYFGLLEVGAAKPGETVVVSGAAGATGSAVGQIAKIHGCKVIGIAGGPDKCRYLVEELGFDGAVDYKTENLMTSLRKHCPKGIDVYYDNVGGKVLDAALANLAMRGRVVVCGAISVYNEVAAPPGPRNYLRLLIVRGRMEGFVVVDFMHRAEEALTALQKWLREGKLKDQVDVMHGLENAPAAVARLFRGENRGKQLLEIAKRGQ